MRAVLKSFMVDPGVPFVMIPGDSVMPKLYADSLDAAQLEKPQEVHFLGKASTEFSWMM